MSTHARVPGVCPFARQSALFYAMSIAGRMDEAKRIAAVQRTAISPAHVSPEDVMPNPPFAEVEVHLQREWLAEGVKCIEEPCEVWDGNRSCCGLRGS